jgi:formylglycine-generating enzyme required for sulfatase activity
MENIRREHIFVKEEREKWWTSKKEHPTEKQYEYIARVAPTADCSI